jgi:hypothetical protein
MMHTDMWASRSPEERKLHPIHDLDSSLGTTRAEWAGMLHRGRVARQKGAGRELLRERRGKGLLGHSGRGPLGIKYGAQDAVRAAGAFMTSGAGLMLMGTAVTAVIGSALIGSAIKRGGEGRQFDTAAIKQDAATQVARIKQNMQIAKGTYGQSSRGTMDRFFDRQSAGLAPAAATAGNFISAGFWGFLGLIGWNLRGGVFGGAYRWATGGDFF